MKVTFVNPKNHNTKEIVSFDWIILIFNFILGIPAFYRGFIPGGIISFLLSLVYYYNIRLILDGGSPNAVNGVLISGLIIILYSLFLANYGPRLRAYSLIKRGWQIKNANSKTVRSQLYKWKIGDSVIKNYNDDMSTSTSQKKSSSNLDELKKLGELFKSEIITEDEFNKKKQELLS